MSRTRRKFPYKLPSWVKNERDLKQFRDGFSSKTSPTKIYKRNFNRLLRTRNKRNLKNNRPFIINKKRHIYDWW